MKVLVCGGRDFNNWTLMKSFMDEFHSKSPISELIHGASPGADTLAGHWAKLNSIPVRSFPAQWNKYHLRAGPKRNQQMLDEGNPQVVIAFPGHYGTQNMKALAQKAKTKNPEIQIIDVEP